MKFDDQIIFDLYYIFNWNQPEIEGMPFTFWISPATLIFKGTTLFNLDFEMDFVNGLVIAEITFELLDGTIICNINTQQGIVVIHATSFEQISSRCFWYDLSIETGFISNF